MNTETDELQKHHTQTARRRLQQVPVVSSAEVCGCVARLSHAEKPWEDDGAGLSNSTVPNIVPLCLEGRKQFLEVKGSNSNMKSTDLVVSCSPLNGCQCMSRLGNWLSGALTPSAALIKSTEP